jgi:hypothetical protein
VPVPALAAYATSRYLAVGLTSLGGLAVHVAASAVAVEIGLAALGGAASLAAGVSLVLLLALIWRGAWPRALWLVVRHAAPILAVAGVVFGVAAGVGALLGGGAWDALAAAAGTAALILCTRAVLPAYWDVARRMVEPLLGGRAGQASYS